MTPMSEPKKIRVAVNGYGVIGKRVVAAVTLQKDMSLAGVSDVVKDWRANTVTRNGFRLFGATGEHMSGMRAAGLEVKGKRGAVTRARYIRSAKATLRKDRRLNIRISTKDLEAIKKRALEDELRRIISLRCRSAILLQSSLRNRTVSMAVERNRRALAGQGCSFHMGATGRRHRIEVET